MIRVGIIGMGVMGRNHFRVLGDRPGCEVVAVCDPALPSPFDVPVYADVDALLERERLDAAIVAVPSVLHKDVALRCIRRGLTVLVEKPLAASVAEGRAIQAAAKTSGARVVVGHVERFNPVVRSLRAELAGREVHNINITRVGPVPTRIADVGVLTDLSVHDIDLIRFLTQREIRTQSIFRSTKLPSSRKEDNAVLSFELENATIGSITTNWLTPFKKRRIEVATENAFYEADLMSQELLEFSAFQWNNSYVTRVCPVRKGEPLASEHDAFLAFVAGADGEDLATVEDGLRALEIVEG